MYDELATDDVVCIIVYAHRGSQEQQPQDGSSQSRYPPPSVVVSSPSSSRPATPTRHAPPAEAAGVIASLKDKSVDELRKLLSDKDAYQHFWLSLDQVKLQNTVSSIY